MGKCLDFSLVAIFIFFLDSFRLGVWLQMDNTEGRSLSSLKFGVSTIALYVESFTQLPQLSLEEMHNYFYGNS